MPICLWHEKERRRSEQRDFGFGARGGTMTIMYDPQATLFFVLSRTRGTIIPLVFSKPAFWVLQFIQLCIVTQDSRMLAACAEEGIQHGTYDEGCRLPPLDWSVVGLPSSLLVFFVVFYGGNCYARFYDMWAQCTELVNLTFEWTARVSFVFDGKEHADLKWHVARLMLAAFAMLFKQLGGDDAEPGEEDPFKGDGLDDSEYEELIKLHLITPAEAEALKAYKGVKCVIPVKWALQKVRCWPTPSRLTSYPSSRRSPPPPSTRFVLAGSRRFGSIRLGFRRFRSLLSDPSSQIPSLRSLLSDPSSQIPPLRSLLSDA